jgi:hypothetical protein
MLLHAPSAPQVIVGEPVKFAAHTPVQVLSARLVAGQFKAPFAGFVFGGVEHPADKRQGGSKRNHGIYQPSGFACCG